MANQRIKLSFDQVVELFSRSKTSKPSEMFADDRYFVVPDDQARPWLDDIQRFYEESKGIRARYGDDKLRNFSEYCMIGLYNLSMWPTEDDYDGEKITTWLIPLAFLLNPGYNRYWSFCLAELYLEHDKYDCPIYDCSECSGEEYRLEQKRFKTWQQHAKWWAKENRTTFARARVSWDRKEEWKLYKRVHNHDH